MLAILTKVFTGNRGWLTDHIQDAMDARTARRIKAEEAKTLEETFEEGVWQKQDDTDDVLFF